MKRHRTVIKGEAAPHSYKGRGGTAQLLMEKRHRTVLNGEAAPHSS